MSDFDFAIVADDIMTVQAFLLRQVLSQYYSVAMWFPKDLEKYAQELAEVPKVFFVGDNPYTQYFRQKVRIRWQEHGAIWGFDSRSAVVLSVDLLQDDPDRIRKLDMTVTDVRREVRTERVTNRVSPGLRAAASFYDPLMNARTQPPMMVTPDGIVQRLQYSIAVGAFLQHGFDEWVWGRRITPDVDRKKLVRRVDR